MDRTAGGVAAPCAAPRPPGAELEFGANLLDMRLTQHAATRLGTKIRLGGFGLKPDLVPDLVLDHIIFTFPSLSLAILL